MAAQCHLYTKIEVMVLPIHKTDVKMYDVIFAGSVHE